MVHERKTELEIKFIEDSASVNWWKSLQNIETKAIAT